MARTFSRLSAVLALWLTAFSPGFGLRADDSVESFEAAGVPEGWRASAGGTLAVTPERFKSGKQSLRWTWDRSGSTLTGAVPDGLLGMPKDKCLAFWLHNERPVEGVLRLELLRRGKVVGSCWYVLNFKGWRPLGAPYGQVCRVADGLGFNEIRLTAPAAAAQGRLHLDCLNPLCADQLRADNQQPWVGNPEMLATATPEEFIYSTHDISYNRPWLPKLKPAAEITAAEQADMDKILERCVDGDKAGGLPRLCKLADNQGLADAKVLDDLKTLLDLRRSPEGVLTGKPVIPAQGWGTWSFNNPPDGVVLSSPPDLGRCSTPILGRLAGAYMFERRQGSPARADMLLRAFLDVCEHLLDQGFAEGNNNISSSGFDVNAVMSMREELGKAGLLRELLLAGVATSMALRGDVLLLQDWEKAGYFPRNTDVAMEWRRLLAMTALLPDPAERLQRLHAYQRAVSLLCDPRLGESLRLGRHHAPPSPVQYQLLRRGVLHGSLQPERHLFQAVPRGDGDLEAVVHGSGLPGGASGVVPPNIPGYAGAALRAWHESHVRADRRLRHRGEPGGRGPGRRGALPGVRGRQGRRTLWPESSGRWAQALRFRGGM